MSGERAMPAVDEDGEINGWVILCPACQCGHKFENDANDSVNGWGFNGNKALPTFTAPMLIEATDEHHRCHFTIDAGRITFLEDCGHPFRGMTLDLPVFGAKTDGD